MGEDLGQTDDVSKNYGSNFLIKTQDEVLWKGLTTLPLHLAASHRRVKSLHRLLAAGADPEMRNHLGQTTLHLVIAAWPNLLTTFLKTGSDFQSTVRAVHRQTEECLQLLCEHGVNVNAEVEDGSHQTALHLSVRYMAPPAVHILASYGADVNAVDNNGMTPLHMACSVLHKDIITSLIKEGADVNMRVKHSGNAPLHLAALALAMKTTKTLKDGKRCVAELLEQGAEADPVNNAGLTPLQEVCSIGNQEPVNLLLRYGANINQLSRAGENCLFMFLNHRPNLCNNSLLVKLLSLTSPLTVYNQNGHLPSTLTLPCFFKQRNQLLKLIKEPRRLQDICKICIYLKYVQGKREELRAILPEKLFDFVFTHWDNSHNISFEADAEQDSFHNISDNIQT